MYLTINLSYLSLRGLDVAVVLKVAYLLAADIVKVLVLHARAQSCLHVGDGKLKSGHPTFSCLYASGLKSTLTLLRSSTYIRFYIAL